MQDPARGVDDVVVARPDVRSSRRYWIRPIGIAALLLTAWALAGCFMEGEDELEHLVPWVVVLDGSVAQERIELACRLFSQGHGYQGMVLTGGSTRRRGPSRVELVEGCGVPTTLLRQWPATANTFEEMSAVAAMLAANPGTQAVVVSDALHMPRLRFVRERLGLNGRVYFRQSRLGGRSDPTYLAQVVVFWFREPLAYVYYRLRY